MVTDSVSRLGMLTQVRPRGLAHVAVQRAWSCIAWRNGNFSAGVPARIQMGRFRLKTFGIEPRLHALSGTWNVPPPKGIAQVDWRMRFATACACVSNMP